MNVGDIERIKNESILNIQKVSDINNASHLVGHRYLSLCTKDELDLVVFGINSFRNTLMWEFSNEFAISMDVINSRFWRSTDSEELMISFDDYHFSSNKRTTMDLHKFQNWLKSQGICILYNFLSRYNK